MTGIPVVIEPTMFRQKRYDEATRTDSERLLDLVAAINLISAAGLRLALSTAAETHRSFERPEANPLNYEATA